MNVLFLDVDGVLNTIRSVRIFGFDYIDSKMVSLVAKIVNETKAEIVLSSSWRTPKKDKKLVEQALGEYSLFIFDCTPVITPPHRGKEIQSWLQNNPVANFAIIDDDSRANIKGHFFQTDENIGLTNEICKKIISHFAEGEKSPI
jgi:hypothetical protein